MNLGIEADWGARKKNIVPMQLNLCIAPMHNCRVWPDRIVYKA